MSEGGEEAATSSIAAVNVKLPPFWPAELQVWFAQVEAQFTTRGISQQQTKFDYVIASLAPAYATEVHDLILQPPVTEAYDTLKQQLIQHIAALEQHCLQQLFSDEELGDRKPTQLLRRMQQLLGDKASTMDSLFTCSLLLQRLPANIQMVLASTPDTADLETFIQLADKIAEVAAPSISVMNTSQLTKELEQLQDEVTSLTGISTSFPQFTEPRRDCPEVSSKTALEATWSPPTL